MKKTFQFENRNTLTEWTGPDGRIINYPYSNHTMTNFGAFVDFWLLFCQSMLLIVKKLLRRMVKHRTALRSTKSSHIRNLKVFCSWCRTDDYKMYSLPDESASSRGFARGFARGNFDSNSLYLTLVEDDISMHRMWRRINTFEGECSR